MKKYRVNVNGSVYEIEIEDISTGDSPARYSVAPRRYSASGHGTAAYGRSAVPAEPVRAAAPAAAPAPAPAAPAPAPAAANQGSGSGTPITAPMPGNIISVRVSEGQDVKKGDVLMILEAMKMENEIMAPCDGKVNAVNVSAGAVVNSGALLCSIG